MPRRYPLQDLERVRALQVERDVEAARVARDSHGRATRHLQAAQAQAEQLLSRVRAQVAAERQALAAGALTPQDLLAAQEWEHAAHQQVGRAEARVDRARQALEEHRRQLERQGDALRRSHAEKEVVGRHKAGFEQELKRREEGAQEAQAEEIWLAQNYLRKTK